DVTPQVLEKITRVFQGCERDPDAPTRYLYNKDLFFFIHGNTEARKYILALHQIHATLFQKDDIEEMLKRWVGIESYQIKVNLTTPTITFLDIETLLLYSIIVDPFVGIVYENSKGEKRVMDVDEL
ncbi:hypothetical protein Tco_0193945, partial [Tanacetum coccineum]